MSRRCGAKHSFKSKCTKHRMFGPLFEAQMSKKIARRCGAKCIYKSKGTKHCMFGPLLFEAQMSKNRAPLWRKVHVESKMTKTPHVRTTF